MTEVIHYLTILFQVHMNKQQLLALACNLSHILAENVIMWSQVIVMESESWIKPQAKNPKNHS